MEDKLRILLITGIAAAVFLLPTKIKAQSTSTSTSTPASSAPMADDLVITEIMYNPKIVNDSKGEWFEIYNPTNQEFDLQGCIFKDNGKDDFTISEQLLIQPQKYLLLGRNNNTSENGGMQLDFTYSGFTLANTEDEIIIVCNEQEIDRVEYSKEKSFPDKEGYSISLADFKLNNNLGENWCLSTSSFGQGDKGTPGKKNDSCQTEKKETPPPQAPSNLPPVAEAGPDQKGLVGEELQFDASKSYDPDQDNLTFYWDFGDGQTAQGKQVSHIYNKPNVYLVILTVDDGTETETDSLTVQITAHTDQTKGKIIINELMPNPAGSDNYEWIELKNISDQPLNIENFSLSDATNKKYTFQSEKLGNLIIPAGGFFVIYKNQSRISLNNTSAEIVKLYDENQNIIDQVIYEPPVPENHSLSLIEGEWHWTKTPTPATNNILTNDNQVSNIQTKENNTTNTDNNQREIDSANSKPSSSKKDKPAECPSNDRGRVVINELWPAPQGNDRELEFIELKNIDSQDTNLCGWQLADTNHTFVFGPDAVIEALDFLVLPRSSTKISLNNNGDVISLTSPDNLIVDIVKYDKAPTNLSWSRTDDGTFSWTEKITPWEDNAITNNKTQPKNQIAKNTSQSNSQTTIKQNPIVQLNAIKNFKVGSQITIQGVVSVPPLALGSQIMYITDPIRPIGLQIYKFDKWWPELKEGDLVEIAGELSTAKNLPRLKITKSGYIKKISSNHSLVVASLSLDQIPSTPPHTLVKTQGEIIEKNKNKIFIASGENEAMVYAKPSTGIKLSFLEEGDIIEVTGILDEANNQIRILPRKKEDIKLTKVKGIAYENQKRASTSSPLAPRSKFSIWDYVNAFLAIIAIIIFIKILQLKNN